MKGHVPPANICQFASGPPLGSKIVRVFAVEVFSAVQVVGYDADAYPTADEDRGVAVRSTAAGEVGGSLSYADVYWDGGVETEG